MVGRQPCKSFGRLETVESGSKDQKFGCGTVTVRKEIPKNNYLIILPLHYFYEKNLSSINVPNPNCPLGLLFLFFYRYL